MQLEVVHYGVPLGDLLPVAVCDAGVVSTGGPNRHQGAFALFEHNRGAGLWTSARVAVMLSGGFLPFGGLSRDPSFCLVL